MKGFTLLLLFGILLNENASAQSFLSPPIEGVSGKDFTIVNYVDWQTIGIQDAYCGTKTYDGHEGTDYVIRSFRQMDSGVAVLSAAKGVVIITKDSLFDRETVSDVSKGLGNYIGIRHNNGYFTYYAHLRKNSLLVRLGDSVEAGQKIGLVGSSGNSTDPHLHFEVYLPNANLIDPFSGSCGNTSSLWLTQQPYDTSFKLWDIGMHNKNVSINNLRERKTTVECCPYQFESDNPQDSLLVWAHMYGLKKGKTLTVNWHQPNNSLWFSYDYTMDQDWWYYYFWSYINNVNLPQGNWKVELVYDGNKVASQLFEVKLGSGFRSTKKKANCEFLIQQPIHQLAEKVPSGEIQILDFNGNQLWSAKSNRAQISLPQLKPGIYIFNFISADGESCVVRRFVE